MKSPTPKQIKAMRGDLSTFQASQLVDLTQRQWQRFEKGDQKMHSSHWKIFQIECKELKCIS